MQKTWYAKNAEEQTINLKRKKKIQVVPEEGGKIVELTKTENKYKRNRNINVTGI